MRFTIPIDESQAEAFHPDMKPDGSGIGVNYADQILKSFKQTFPDGRKMLAKRRGLRITLTIGDNKGEAVMRRLDHGPDVRIILHKALEEAASNAGVSITFESGAIHLDL